MENATFGLGVIELLDNAIDWFKYIQLAKNADEAISVGFLKLQVASVRLSRWGELVGVWELAGNEEAVNAQLVTALGSQHRAELAKTILGHVLRRLRRAQDDHSSTISANRVRTDEEAQSHHTGSNLTQTARNLHEDFYAMSISNRQPTTLLQKVHRALYQKDSMEELMRDVKELVDNLFQLCPNGEERQRQLCVNEVSQIKDPQSLRLLQKIIRGQDDILAQETARKITQGKDVKSGLYHIDFSGSHNMGLQVGYNQGTLSGISIGAEQPEAEGRRQDQIDSGLQPSQP
ncbi:hypothetical protein MMC10_005400 [Thelotrema lepadinum]|nr:hypothetical protein [Thelotrema lepadinum]